MVDRRCRVSRSALSLFALPAEAEPRAGTFTRLMGKIPLAALTRVVREGKMDRMYSRKS
jgi:hypothetical protein